MNSILEALDDVILAEHVGEFGNIRTFVGTFVVAGVEFREVISVGGEGRAVLHFDGQTGYICLHHALFVP